MWPSPDMFHPPKSIEDRVRFATATRRRKPRLLTVEPCTGSRIWIDGGPAETVTCVYTATGLRGAPLAMHRFAGALPANR